MGRPLQVEADGGSRGNPGVAGFGALVRDPATGRVLAERAAPLGLASNNVAEYSGLIAGLEAAAEIDPGADVDVAMDSKLVVEQMSGRWKIKHEDMRRLALQAREVAAGFTRSGGSVRYRWIPRAENGDADRLSNVGMDGHHVHDGPGESTDGGTDTDTHTDIGAVSVRAQEVVDSEAPSMAPEPTPPAVGAAPSARLVLVRHGVTAFTEQVRLDGRGGADPSLSERGLAQARRAGESVSALVGSDTSQITLVSSSLARARETASEIASALGVSAGVDPRLDEQSFGDWDGASIEDLVRDEPQALQSLRGDVDYRRPGGESHADLAERVLAAYADRVAAGGTSILVCHRKPIMVVLAHLLGIDPERAWRLAAAPGSLTAVEVWADGHASVAFTNRV